MGKYVRILCGVMAVLVAATALGLCNWRRLRSMWLRRRAGDRPSR